MAEKSATQKARRTTLSAAVFVLICFFLPWVQVGCLGLKDSESGLNMARSGNQQLWLLPFSMLLILFLGAIRFIWKWPPALFALCGMVGGSLSLWLMLHERWIAGNKSGLVAVHWTGWFWLGVAGSLAVSGSALWFYAEQVRGP